MVDARKSLRCVTSFLNVEHTFLGTFERFNLLLCYTNIDILVKLHKVKRWGLKELHPCLQSAAQQFLVCVGPLLFQSSCCEASINSIFLEWLLPILNLEEKNPPTQPSHPWHNFFLAYPVQTELCLTL